MLPGTNVLLGATPVTCSAQSIWPPPIVPEVPEEFAED